MPEVQAVQELCPEAAEYVPAWHEVHALAPTALYCPALHGIWDMEPAGQ